MGTILPGRTEIAARELAEGSTKTKAYLAAHPGVSLATADAYGAQWIKAHPEITKRAIEICQQTTGLTKFDALEAIKRGLTAETVGKYGKQPDWQAQHENAKTLLKLHNELSDEKAGTNIGQVNIITIEDTQKVADLVDKIKRMDSQPDIVDGEVTE